MRSQRLAKLTAAVDAEFQRSNEEHAGDAAASLGQAADLVGSRRSTAVGAYAGLNLEIAERDKEIERLKAAGARVKVPLHHIRIQHHRKLDDEHAEALRKAWEAGSEPEPIVVRRLGRDEYDLVSGQHRIEAARRLGKTDIDSYIVELDDIQANLRILTANNFKAVPDWEKAKGIARQMALQPGLTQDKLAALIGMAQTSVSQLLAMHQLPEAIKSQLDRAPERLGRTAAVSVILHALRSHPARESEVVEAVIDLLFVRGIDQAALKGALALRLKPRDTTPGAHQRLRVGNRFSVRRSRDGIAVRFSEDVDVDALLDQLQDFLARFDKRLSKTAKTT